MLIERGLKRRESHARFPLILSKSKDGGIDFLPIIGMLGL